MKYVFMLLLLFAPPLFSAEDYYQFDSTVQQQRFASLTKQLRCLVCQNQNIAESNAPLATDLRDQIYYQIQQGKSDQAIFHYLVERYGNFILYRPPLTESTFVLWVGPFLILLGGIGYLILYLLRERNQT